MKKAIALLMAVTMLLSFAACGSKDGDKTTAASDTTTAASEEVNGTTVADETTAVPETEIVTEVVTDKDGEKVTDKSGEIVTKKTVSVKKTTTQKGQKTTKATTKKTTAKTTASSVKDPSSWSTAEVLSYYKTATAKVVSEKPGFKKARESKLNSYDAGIALKAFKSLVFKFIGVGDENKYSETVNKGSLSASKFQSFNTSKLTTNDVKSAKCVKSGSNYIVTINVKDGTSSISGGKSIVNNSPIDKSVINIGTTDRSEFDHKTAQIVYDAIDDFAEGAIIKETTSNCSVVATINASSGKISKIVVSFKAVADLQKVAGSKATLNASSTIVYSNFGW